MVQAISLDGLVLQNQKNTDITDKKTANIDFLELLLKDLDLDSNTEDKESLDIDKKVDNKDKDDNELKLDKDILKFDTKLNLKLDSKSDKIDLNQLKEIKNIITSKFKQENILLSKKEIKEFKQIDNLKDLIKFADKKGLNIEKLSFDIEKELKNKPKLDLTDIEKKATTKTTKEKESKQSIVITTKEKLDTKQKSKELNLKKETTSDKKISLENIISPKEIKKDNQVHKKTKHKSEKHIQSKLKSDTKAVIITKNEKQKIDNKQIELTKDNKPQKLNLEALLNNKDNKKSKSVNQSQTIKHNIIEKTEKEVKIDSLETLLSPKTKVESKKETKTNIDVNINQQNMVNELKAKTVQAKETINHFKNNLDEAIKNYKPPISKVDIELNPKNLGKVEVSIIQRGNNIQVHMNTDQSNVALFQNHQAEFRQALANIGFSNIDMSFNSNQDRERKQNQAKKAYKDNENQEIEIGEIEIKANYKYA